MLKKNSFSGYIAHEFSIAKNHFLIQGKDVDVLCDLSFIFSATEICDFQNVTKPYKGLSLP